MFDYDLTLVKCGKAASPGQYCLYLRVENYEDTNPKINNARFLKTLTSQDYSALVKKKWIVN